MAGSDQAFVQARANGRKDITVSGYEPQIDRVMAAANVAVSKGTRKTLFELTQLGIPSVSIPNPSTRVDRFRSAHFPGTITLDDGVSAELLARHLMESANRVIAPARYGNAARNCAGLILSLRGECGDETTIL